VTSDFRAHSFDNPRPRRAPTSFSGRDADGLEFTRTLAGPTLVVALKTSCDGCREFVAAALEEFDGLDLVLITATSDEASEWRGARRPVVAAPGLWTALDLRSAPFYVLVDPELEQVLTEGVVFSPAQVASEIARFVTR